MEICRFEDCSVQYDGNLLVLKNSRIAREYALKDGRIIPGAVRDLHTGRLWENGQSPVMLADFGLDMRGSRIEFAHRVADNHHISRPYLSFSLSRGKNGVTITVFWSLYPGHPFMTAQTMAQSKTPLTVTFSRDGQPLYFPPGDETALRTAGEAVPRFSLTDAVDVIGLPQGHLKLRSVRLFDKTDNHDTLTMEEERELYRNQELFCGGNLFLLEDALQGDALLLVKEAPTPLSQLGYHGFDLHIPRRGYAELTGSGLSGAAVDAGGVWAYGSTVGVGKKEEILSLYKRFYRESCMANRKETFIMSNTWGDRNQDAAVCEDFMRKEVDAAAELGVEIVQIDDGWQSGVTTNSRRAKGGVFEGYYAFDPNFWNVNIKQFPHGIRFLSRYAKEKGIALGLWFSPDSSREFANWEKDVEVVLRLYREEEAVFFKLDGVKLTSKTAESNYRRFLNAVMEQSEGKIAFNQDITAADRPGYLYLKQYGTLFVENRYTDWGNYYPHNTLKNLWSLNRYFPAGRFQMELLNNRRNADKYDGDKLAPGRYSADYLFASVMLANPLLWMEMSYLVPEDRKSLQKIIACYKRLRKDFFAADILSIGSMPDGLSFTGFQVICGEKDGYFLFFREMSEKDHARYSVALKPFSGFSAELLYASLPSGGFSMTEKADEWGELTVKMESPGSFALVRYTLP